MPNLNQVLSASLKKHEGVRTKPYKDTMGILTIGVGRNLEKGLSQAAIQFLLNEDIAEATAGAKKLIPSLESYSVNRQAAIIEMVFNLGEEKFATFKRTVAALNEQRWDDAAAELKDSAWADEVGPTRVNDIVEMIKAG